MYKNQLQELAQRSCFNLPSYTSIREGPDHAPRFKSTVNFNGETFESPNYCTTLRLAEHSAAEVALNALASRGPSNSLAARVLDETGVYKNLLQEVSQRVGASLPTYTTFRSGLGHLPVFTGVVELAGFIFTGEPAKNKKQAEKNAAMAAWSSLKSLTQQSESSSSSQKINDEQEHVTVARALQKFRVKAVMSNIPFPIKFPTPEPKTTGTQTPPPAASSKILPLICPRTTRTRPGAAAATTTTTTIRAGPQPRPVTTTTMNNNILPFYLKTATERQSITTTTGGDSLPQKFPVAGAPPYIPVRHYRATAHHGIAPPVTIRNAIPVYSAPPIPPPHIMRPPPPVGVAPPVCVRQAVPVFAAPPVQVKEAPQPVQVQEPPVSKAQIVPLVNSTVQIEPNESAVQGSPVPVEEPPVSPSPPAANPLPEREIAVVEELKELKM